MAQEIYEEPEGSGRWYLELDDDEVADILSSSHSLRNKLKALRKLAQEMEAIDGKRIRTGFDTYSEFLEWARENVATAVQKRKEARIIEATYRKYGQPSGPPSFRPLG